MREDERRRALETPQRERAPAPLISEPGGYAYWSTRPLHVLVFLLPLILVYEIGSALYLSHNGQAIKTIRAERILSSFFELFGAGGLYLPGIVLIVVLLMWHILSRDKWRVHWQALLGMLVEAVVWAIPLLVLGQIMQRAFHGDPAVFAAAGQAAAPGAAGQALGLSALSTPARATISLGAGIYEELLFRLVAIALFHTIAADLLRIRDGAAKVIAVFAAAIAFALYHDIMLPGGGLDPARLATYTLAGLYFGTVYILRGFGIVVAVHAVYDLAVLVLLPG